MLESGSDMCASTHYGGISRAARSTRLDTLGAMKILKRIKLLIEEGRVDEVVRQLMSGKEATVYVVRCGNEIRCARMPSIGPDA